MRKTTHTARIFPRPLESRNGGGNLQIRPVPRMKRNPFLFFVLLLAGAFAFGFLAGRSSVISPAPGAAVSDARPTPTPTATPAESEKTEHPALCPVVRIESGDTVVIQRLGVETTVRLLMLKTPPKGSYGHKKTVAAMRDLLGKRPVRLEFERPGEPARDAQDRLLAYLFTGEMHINVEMVRRGMSRFHFGTEMGRYGRSFQEAEDWAREAYAGFWEGTWPSP